MHLEKLKIYQGRVSSFYSCLLRDYVKDTVELNAEYCVSEEPLSFEEKDKCKFKAIRQGDIWGRDWQCAWFHLTGTIPDEWNGENVCARINLGGEGLLFSATGMPLRSITNHSVFQPDYVNEYFPLYDSAKGGHNVELWVDAGANGYFGVELNNHPRLDTAAKEGRGLARANALQLCLTDEELRQLSIDWEIAMSLLKVYPQNHYRYRQIISVLVEAINLYKGKTDNAHIVRCLLKEKLFSAKSCDSALKVTAVGHSHIDTAWLWPMRETIRKCGRTFANQIANIEKFPEYVFGASQPQHYQFVKERYPALYAKVKKAVAAGRWEPQGGMWVEADCNLISGESMIRQFLHGKNFFMEEFGIEVKNLWLPDVFGYSGIMPQIIKGCGCDFFLTQKISWNQFNKFPHNTFIWKGIDGSEVLTHFPPESDYNAMATPEQIANAQNEFKEADSLPEFLSLFGIGDGGGGPSENHIERAMRLKNLEGVPKVSMGKASDFFERLAVYSDKLDIWEGELYLEKHQGTLTTQAKVKRANRKLEYLLKNVEILFACLPLSEYPGTIIDKAWKKLLVNQFHDILPGSSITRVYRETEQQHRELSETCGKLLEKVASILFIKDDNCLTLFNPLSCVFNGAISLPEGWQAASLSGKCIAGQDNGATVDVSISIPAGSFVTLEKSDLVMPRVMTDDCLILENEQICYEFNRQAQLIRAFDKEVGKELLDSCQMGNMLSLYHDDPANFDAWDVDIGYEAQFLENASGKAFSRESGPIQQTLTFELAIGNSKIRQRIVLRNGKRLDFETFVLWNECHKMLRVQFPANINASEVACDLQYGFIKRSCSQNTSWDMAKYEVAAHRYVDISDSQYGIALLNDCKYGHKIHGRILDLNLLRSSKYPDFTADLGEHSFTYSIMPHIGTLTQSNVISEAAMLNQPPLQFNGYRRGHAVLPCTLDSNNISLEVIKKAEKEDCLIIRLVETKGELSNATIHFNLPVKQLFKTNLIEWGAEKTIPIAEKDLNIILNPFEIRTYKLMAQPSDHET